MKESLLVIPEEFLKSLQEKQDQILALLENRTSKESDFLTEKQAMELLNRKATWFWQMRKEGLLPYSKIGKAIYYSLVDIKTVLDNTKINSGSSNKSK